MVVIRSNNNIKSFSDFENPFHGRDSEEVWRELKEKTKPITKEELFKHILEAKTQNKK